MTQELIEGMLVKAKCDFEKDDINFAKGTIGRVEEMNGGYEVRIIWIRGRITDDYGNELTVEGYDWWVDIEDIEPYSDNPNWKRRLE